MDRVRRVPQNGAHLPAAEGHGHGQGPVSSHYSPSPYFPERGKMAFSQNCKRRSCTGQDCTTNHLVSLVIGSRVGQLSEGRQRLERVAHIDAEEVGRLRQAVRLELVHVYLGPVAGGRWTSVDGQLMVSW